MSHYVIHIDFEVLITKLLTPRLPVNARGIIFRSALAMAETNTDILVLHCRTRELALHCRSSEQGRRLPLIR
jgi:hypothetical protein